MNRLGPYLKHRRNVLKMTQGEFAEKLGVSRISVANWELGKYPPNRDKFPRIARLLHTTQGKLLKLTGYQIGRKDAGQVTIPIIPLSAFPPDLENQAVDTFRIERMMVPEASSYLSFTSEEGTVYLFEPNPAPPINAWAVVRREIQLTVGRLIVFEDQPVLIDQQGQSFEVESDDVIGRLLMVILKVVEPDQ